MHLKIISSTPSNGLPQDAIEHIQRTISLTKQHLEGRGSVRFDEAAVTITTQLKDNAVTKILPLLQEIDKAYYTRRITQADIETCIKKLEQIIRPFIR